LAAGADPGDCGCLSGSAALPRRVASTRCRSSSASAARSSPALPALRRC
jgi:hypothetical protein